MVSIIHRAIEILREEGVLSFANKTSSYLTRFGERIYWRIRNKYSLSIKGIQVVFSSPNRDTVKRNIQRFKSEKEVIMDLIQEVSEDDVVYDIGANTGIYTLFLSNKCSKVVAFEPYPPNVSLLKKDILRNDAKNVEVYKIALSDSNDAVSFNLPDEKDIGYGSASINVQDTKETVKIPTYSGDKLIAEKELPNPTILKIDVEGAEPLVIDGLKDTITSSECRLVYCEVHTGNVEHRPSIYDFDKTLSDVKAQFREWGFKVTEIQSRDFETFLKAEK